VNSLFVVRPIFASALAEPAALRRLPLPAVEEVEQLVFHPRTKTVVKQYTCKVIAIPEAGHEEASGEVFSPLPDYTVAAALASSEQIFASGKPSASISATFLPFYADALAKEKGRGLRLPFSSASGGPRRTWTGNETQSSLPKPATVRRTWSPDPLDLRSDSNRLGLEATVEELATPWRPWQPLATAADVSVK